MLVLFAGWVPPEFCASRSCLSLATDIAAEAAALNDREDSPPGHRAAETIDERTRPVPAPPVTAAWATPPAQSPRQTLQARVRWRWRPSVWPSLARPDAGSASSAGVGPSRRCRTRPSAGLPAGTHAVAQSEESLDTPTPT